jgi:hypothetical protein
VDCAAEAEGRVDPEAAVSYAHEIWERDGRSITYWEHFFLLPASCSVQATNMRRSVDDLFCIVWCLLRS